MLASITSPQPNNSVYLSIYLCLSIYLSIYLFIFPSISSLLSIYTYPAANPRGKQHQFFLHRHVDTYTHGHLCIAIYVRKVPLRLYCIHRIDPCLHRPKWVSARVSLVERLVYQTIIFQTIVFVREFYYIYIYINGIVNRDISVSVSILHWRRRDGTFFLTVYIVFLHIEVNAKSC